MIYTVAKPATIWTSCSFTLTFKWNVMITDLEAGYSSSVYIHISINSTCDSLADTTEIDCLFMYIASGTSLHTVTQDHFDYSLGILN